MPTRSLVYSVLILALAGSAENTLDAQISAVRVLHDQAHGQTPPPAQLAPIADRLGLEIATSDQPLTEAALERADILYLRAPTTAFSADEKNAIVDFVRKGGSLFLVLDEERRQSLSGTGVNDLIAPFGLQLTPDHKAPHNTGALARAGEIHKADREVPYSGGRAVEGGTPFSFVMGDDGRPTNVAHGAFTKLDSGARIVVLGDAMATIFMGTPDGRRLQGTTPQDTVYWGKDSAIFMEEVLAWLK
jgi:hypothetical protein